MKPIDSTGPKSRLLRAPDTPVTTPFVARAAGDWALAFQPTGTNRCNHLVRSIANALETDCDAAGISADAGSMHTILYAMTSPA